MGGRGEPSAEPQPLGEERAPGLMRASTTLGSLLNLSSLFPQENYLLLATAYYRAGAPHRARKLLTGEIMNAGRNEGVRGGRNTTKKTHFFPISSRRVCLLP